MNILETLYGRTFVLEHNPNMVEGKQFMVRLPSLGLIDREPDTRKTKDILGYGSTFEQAAKEALEKKDAADKERAERLKTLNS